MRAFSFFGLRPLRFWNRREGRRTGARRERREKRARSDGGRRVAKRAVKYTILSLPDDVLQLILQPLPLRDVVAVSETCQRLRQVVCAADEIWRTVLPGKPGGIKRVQTESLRESQSHVQKGRSRLAFKPKEELSIVSSPGLDRLKAVANHGEFSITHNSWLVFLGWLNNCMWGYVTLGSELNNIVRGSDEEGGDEGFWTRCKSSHVAALHRCWWFEVSTAWTVSQAGSYRAFVVISTDSCPVQISSLNQVEVLVACERDGFREVTALGMLLGSENRVIQKGGIQETVLHVSMEFDVATDGEKISIYLKDADTTTEKKSTRIYGIGIIPVQRGSQCTDLMRHACLQVHNRALGFAQGSDEASLARHISFRGLSRAGARFRRRISMASRTSDMF